MILSDSPLNRNYRTEHGVFVDKNLRTAENLIMSLIKSSGHRYLSLGYNNVVVGRSWEMAAVNAILNNDGVFSGTLSEIRGGVAHYGPVPGVNLKRSLDKNLITVDEKSSDLLSR